MDLDRLAKVCGMLGSSHQGERAAAALKATELLRDAGLTWAAFVRSRVETPRPAQEGAVERPHAKLARKLLGDFYPGPLIDDRTSDFLEDLMGRNAFKNLTVRQQAWLDDIERRCRRAANRKAA